MKSRTWIELGEEGMKGRLAPREKKNHILKRAEQKNE